MSDYKVKVVVSEYKLPTKDIENKITDFQSVFATIASRYYNDKSKADNKIVGNSEAK
ncbi:hypothetical protein [Shimazuella alba]|jgi:hypothetical protein|uniref:Uncharacterized protein n=1 Tax=Shimazuella alba TaxID=2690964 RepID=A0A6I4VZU0_9BACL|nr:hypothetical protein [Shimazuella alba]MXQ53582.1 hypothetical protein [Shimazuella alba]